MKGLATITVVFMPYTMISGIWGMNVTVPYITADYPDTLAPFFVIVTSMFLLSFLFIGIFKYLALY